MWALGGYAHDAMRQARAQATKAVPLEPLPFNGPIGHIKDYLLTSDDRFFSDVQEDRDAQGARIFWVTYASGQRVQQYQDPRIIR